MLQEKCPSVDQRLRLLALVQRIHALSPDVPVASYDEYILSRLWAVADAVVNTDLKALRSVSGPVSPSGRLNMAEHYRAVATLCLCANVQEIYLVHPNQWDSNFPTFEAIVAASENAVDRWLSKTRSAVMTPS